MRARNLKPGFFHNEQLLSLSPLHRLLFEGLWCVADWKGRLEDRPGKIKIEVLPGDPCDINQLLDDLADADHLIIRYQVEGRHLIQVTTFQKHQHVSEKEKRSECLPPPPQWCLSGSSATGADHGLLQPVSGIKEVSPQLDTGTNPVASRNEPGTIPAASQDEARSPFSTALPHTALPQTALPQTTLPQTALPSENLSTRARKKSEIARTYTLDFERFWQEYPSHIDKNRAFSCWKSRLKEGITSDQLSTCACNYAVARRGEDERFTMHPSTFLGPGRRWEEFLIHPNESQRRRFIGDPVQPRVKGSNGRPKLTWADEELPAFSPAAQAWMDLPTSQERRNPDE